MTEWRRHDLLLVAPEAWANLLGERSDLAASAELWGWAEAARPVIVRRALPGDPPGTIPSALPLPGKVRIAISVPTGAVLRRLAAPGLARLRTIVSPAWRPALDALAELAGRLETQPRGYGSAAWQAMTALPYLSATSDLDLLWPCPADTRALLDGLTKIDVAAPMAIDGEIVLPDGGGVAWRELHEALTGRRADEVLVKHVDGLRTASATAIVAAGPARVAA